MNRFSRVRHHVSVEDVKKKHLEKIAVENFVKAEEEITKNISEKFKRNWRKELSEGMTTGNMYVTTLSPEGDTAIDQVAPTDAASFSDTTNMFGADASNPALDGTTIRANGSGSGSEGGFNVGGNYLAFQGTGSGGSRMALLKPMDATKVDTLTITAIRGNSSNGGEEADIVGQEELFLIYKTPEMSRSSYLSQDRNQNNIGTFPDDAAIIAIGQGDGTLQDYSITIPEYARQKNVIFGLFQLSHSGSGFDHYGITDIKFQRKAPMNVVVPLDDPEAISFVRVGTNEGDPKKRKKKIDDQLAASDEYTSQQMGGDFPGQGARLDGEDPFKSAEVQDVAAPSPIGKPAVTKSFADFQTGPEKVEVLKTPEQKEAQKTEYYNDLNNVIERGEYSYDDPQIVEIADKILKLDPTSIDAYFYKSAYYDMTGETEKGLKVIDQLIKNNPNSSDGYAVRSYYKEETGDYRGAISDIEKSIELNPDAEFVAYLEADLADLKFNLADLESDFAEKERLESEAGAIEKKAHQDYWDNADLIEPEEPVEYEYVDDKQLVRDLYGMNRNLDPKMIPSLNRQAADWASGVEVIDTNPLGVSDIGLSDLYAKAESWEGTPEEFAQYYTNWLNTEWWTDGDERSRMFGYNSMIDKLNRMGKSKSISIGKVSLVFQQYKLSDIKNMAPDEVIDRFRRASYEYNRYKERYETTYKNASSKTNTYVINIPPRLHNLGNYIKALSENLPDYFFESQELAPVNTLYDQMKALYDEEDPEKEIKTELKELGFDQQYKDLMTAWDSADKFSKFITPLANLSKAFGNTLGKIGKAVDDNITAGANNAQLENYKIAIAKSVLLNRPIRVDPTTISTTLKQKLAMGINPNMISTYDVEAAENLQLKGFDKDGILKYDYIQENPDFEGTGMGVIPVVREPVPYADFNIYTDKAGKVYNQERNASGDTSVPNTTFQPDKSFTSGFMQGAFASLTRQNPLASRGQAQYQVVVPPDGSEPYLLYEDHAYYNIDSQDPGEAPLLNDPAARFVNWLGNTAYKRNDGDANTGGMAGYPPNIRGDVITKFRINASDLPRGVREAIYRHPFLSENPGIAQAIEDKLYNEREIKTMLGSKGLHNYYMNRQRLANTFKDFAVDKSIELIMGLPSIEGTKNDLRSASNMLQKYDDYIQATVFQPDGKTYIPGIVDADGRVQSRIDVTDEFVKVDQNHLKSMFNDDEDIQKVLRSYVKGDTNKNTLSSVLQARIGDIMNASNPAYRKVLANSLGKGTRVNVDEFLRGKIVLEKNFEFRDETVNSNWAVESIANMFDVSTDTAAAGGFFTSLATMAAARHLLNPVRGPGILPGMKQTFRQAMNSAPTMPYKLEFDLSEKMMKILQGVEETDPRDGIAGLDEPVFFDPRKKNNKKNSVKESTLFERVKSKQFFNPKDIKPTFPENPPPEIDKKTGMHPNYGKQAKRYRKLDPMSANAMPPTGDPEIDAVVDKQRTKKRPSERRQDYIKTVSKIKKMAKGV